MDIDLPAVKVFGLKLEVGVELINRRPKGLAVPDHLADGCPIDGLQHTSEGSPNNGHGVQRNVVLINPLQIGPDTATILWRCRTLAPEADGIVASQVQREYRFKPEVTDSVIDEIVDGGETLPLMEAQRYEWHVPRINIEAMTAKTPAAVFLAVNTKAVQLRVAPSEHDLQRGM